MRALWIEDDADIRDALSTLLEAHGCEVTSCATAEVGLAHLRAGSFSLLVTDLRLPGGDGAWLIRKARSEGLLTGTRVVMVTASLELPALDQVHVLRKPIDVQALLRLCGL